MLKFVKNEARSICTDEQTIAKKLGRTSGKKVKGSFQMESVISESDVTFVDDKDIACSPHQPRKPGRPKGSRNKRKLAWEWRKQGPSESLSGKRGDNLDDNDV